MSPRILVVIIFIIGFFMSLYVASNAYQIWSTHPNSDTYWTMLSGLLAIILGFGSLGIAYWVYDDGERIRELEKKVQT